MFQNQALVSLVSTYEVLEWNITSNPSPPPKKKKRDSNQNALECKNQHRYVHY